METNNTENDLKSKLLNGTADVDLTRKLLEIIMNTPGIRYMKIILKDKREIYGSLIYLDENRILLVDCEEHYKGYEHYIRHLAESLIPTNIIERAEIKRTHFDICYEQLSKIY